MIFVIILFQCLMQISQESLISGDFYLCEPNEEIIDLNYKCDNFDCNLMMNTLKLFSKIEDEFNFIQAFDKI